MTVQVDANGTAVSGSAERCEVIRSPRAPLTGLVALRRQG
jgi:hypothetical protein